jgi:hypothetical protein
VYTFQKQKGSNSEADNFSAIAFGAMATLWNDHIQEEEEGRREKSDMMLKSAYHLQHYWKQFRRDTNTAATMLPIHEGNQSLRREWRQGPTRESEVTVAPVEMARDRVLWLTSSAAAAVAMPFDGTASDDEFCLGGNDDGDDISLELILPSLEAVDVAESKNDDGGDAVVTTNGEGTAATDANSANAPAVAPTKQRKPRQGPRCTKCGHEYSKNSPYVMYHEGLGKRGINSLQPKDVCTVPESERKLNPDGTLPNWYERKKQKRGRETT